MPSLPIPGSGTVPLSGDGGHWNDSVGINVGTEDVGQPTIMTSTLPRTLFDTFSALDFAGLRDIGWETFAMPGPALSLDVATSEVTDEVGTVTVSATLATATDIPVSVPLTIGGTAQAVDFTASADFLYIAPGQRTASVTVEIQNDDEREDDETVTVTLGTPTNATLGSTTTQTITILQNDQPPTVDFTVDNQAVEETVGTVTVTARLSEATDEIVTVPLTFTGNANNEDFTSSASELTIAAGATTGTITLSVINDPAPEGDETIQIAMGTPTNADLGTTTSQTVTISENDQPPAIQFTTAAPDPVQENVGNVILTVSIPTASESVISVPVTFAGTADGEDFTASATEFTIPVGQTSATLTLSITDEEVREDNDETIIARLGTPTNAVLGSVSQQTVTILRNDQPPTIEFTTDSQPATERSGTVTVTATLSKTSTQEVTVPLTFGGSANDQDYTRSAESITIAAGATSGSVTLTINNDTDPEPAETIIVTLGTPDGADLGTTRSQTINLAFSDQPPVIELSTDMQDVNEASGNVTVTAQLSKVWTEEVTVQVGFSGNANAQDFTASATSITIPVGQTSGSITLTIEDDDDAEQAETIRVTLSSPTEATLGTARTQDVIIAASDLPPEINWTTDAQSVEETVGTVTLNATLSFAAVNEVSIPLTYVGTAARDSDYTASNATLVIPAGQTAGSIQLNVTNDADEEDLETVVVSLGATTGVVLGDTVGQTISIVANDPRPTVELSVAEPTVREEVGTVIVTATLSATSESNIVVPLTFAGTAGVTDYTPSASSISIPAGQTSGTVTLTINDDDLVENDDTIMITMGQSANVVLGSTASQVTTM